MLSSSPCGESSLRLPARASLARRIRRPANVQVAQISQSRFVFLAHASCELRIVQPLIPGELWHVLQHSQPLPDRLPPVLRHLSPPWQHIVSNVSLLFRRQPVPCLDALLHLLPLRRWHAVQPVVVVDDPLLLLRRQVVEFSLRLRRNVRGGWTVRIRIRIRPRHESRRTVPSTLLGIPCPAALPSLLLSSSLRIFRLLSRLRSFLTSRRGSGRTVLLLRPVRAPALRRHGSGQQRAEPYRQQASSELESVSHELHRRVRIRVRLLVLLLVLVLVRSAVIVCLHWLRQVG